MPKTTKRKTHRFTVCASDELYQWLGKLFPHLNQSQQACTLIQRGIDAILSERTTIARRASMPDDCDERPSVRNRPEPIP